MTYTLLEQETHAKNAVKENLAEYCQRNNIKYIDLLDWIELYEQGEYRKSNVLPAHEVQDMLKQKGYTLTDIANSLSVNASAVWLVVNGEMTSKRIQDKICRVLKMKHNELWKPARRKYLTKKQKTDIAVKAVEAKKNRIPFKKSAKKYGVSTVSLGYWIKQYARKEDE